MISRRNALKLGTAGLVTPSLAGTYPQPTMAAREQRGSVPMFRGNPARTGEMPGPGPSLDKPIVVKWKLASGRETPAVVDEVLYSEGNESILAVDSTTGEVRWSFESDRGVESELAVAGNTLLAAWYEGPVTAIDITSRQELWRLENTEYGRWGSPAVKDGTAFIGQSSGNLFAVDIETGDEVWRFVSEESINDPAVDNGSVFFGDESYVYSLDAKSGSEQWRFAIQRNNAAPSVMDGIVLETSGTGTAYALDSTDGQERWRFSVDGAQMVLGPAVVANGLVFLAMLDEKDGSTINLHAVDLESGIETWRFASIQTNFTVPSIGDGILYIGSDQGDLIALDAATGDERWRYFNVEGITSSAVVVDGFIYVGCGDGYLYALGNLETTVLTDDVTLRGGPSSSAVERGTAKAGDVVDTVGPREVREGQEWAEVTIGDVTGWIPLDAIDPATLPPEGEIEYVYIPK